MDETCSMGLAEFSMSSTSPDERRTAPRFPAVEGRARFGWRVQGDSRECAALILNVSEVGALVVVDELPPEDVVVALRLAGTASLEWVEARVVLTFATHSGPHKIGLAFTRPCPIDLLTTTIFSAPT